MYIGRPTKSEIVRTATATHPDARYIDLIEQQHRELCSAYTMEPTLRASLDGLDSSSAFDDSWKVVKDRFPILQQFCGGIATVFPHNAQVESDFSIVKSLKDQFRVAITDLSLEGCQHCMQYEYLQSLTFE
ncbi:DUF659 domain-containing protein [Plasmodiophora brassicae]